MSSTPGAGDPQPSVVQACRVLHSQGQSDHVWGHVSVRDDGGRGVWLKSSRLGLDEVTSEDVILLSWDGKILKGRAERHLEYPIHLEIMRARPDVNAVVHTHPLHSIAFAGTGWPLKHLSHEWASFTPTGLARFTATSDLITTPELGRALAHDLNENLAILMPHHGITTAAGSVGDAVAAAVQLERACQIALLAGANSIPASEEDAVRKQRLSAGRLRNIWDYLSRVVGTLETDARRDGAA